MMSSKPSIPIPLNYAGASASMPVFSLVMGMLFCVGCAFTWVLSLWASWLVWHSYPKAIIYWIVIFLDAGLPLLIVAQLLTLCRPRLRLIRTMAGIHGALVLLPCGLLGMAMYFQWADPIFFLLCLGMVVFEFLAGVAHLAWVDKLKGIPIKA